MWAKVHVRPLDVEKGGSLCIRWRLAMFVAEPAPTEEDPLLLWDRVVAEVVSPRAHDRVVLRECWLHVFWMEHAIVRDDCSLAIPHDMKIVWFLGPPRIEEPR